MNTPSSLRARSVLTAFCTWCTIGGLIAPSRGEAPPEPKASTNAVDKAQCQAQLLRIHAAIQQYRARHGRVPDWLSDLSREELIPEPILTCPFVVKTLTLVEWRRDLRDESFRDAKSSYSYEFCAAELPLFGGAATNWREYKERKMRLMGADAVPIVRCPAHRPYLNLTYAGSIYESEKYWEDKYTNRVQHFEIVPDALFAERLQLPRLEVDDFPARSPGASWQQLDLTRHYNARLTDTWQHAPSFPNNLAEFPAGTWEAAGVKFDARGIIQLKAITMPPPYPMAVAGIPVGRRCAAIHFLHATGAQATPGTEVGHYILRYEDGSTALLPIRYGRDVSDWWHDVEGAANPNLVVAWASKIPDEIRGDRELCLFQSRYRNEKPDITVQTLDFTSANTSAAPFLIAVTLE